MNKDSFVDVHVYNRNFQVKCPEDEIENLHKSAAYLDRKMRFMANTQNIIGLDRLAIIAALNIIHELSKNENAPIIKDLDQRIQQLCDEVEKVLNPQGQLAL